jgi:hypothetical protein
MKSKGQMFLIMSAVTFIVLILLKNSINISDILQNKRELEVRFEKEYFSNIVDEMKEVVGISFYNQDNITNNVFDFGNFIRRKMKERTQDFNFLYVGLVTAGMDNNMSVKVINLLNKPINATLRLNSSDIVNNSEMADASSWEIYYSIIHGNGYVITVGYNNTYRENITINTKINKSVYVGFFDITLSGAKTTYREIFQKSYTLTTPMTITTSTSTSTTSTASTTSTIIPKNYLQINGTTFTQPQAINITGWCDDLSKTTYIYKNASSKNPDFLMQKGTGKQYNISLSSAWTAVWWNISVNSTDNATLEWRTFRVVGTSTSITSTTTTSTGVTTTGITTIQYSGGGGGGGRMPLMMSLNYTNITIMLIALIVLVIMVFGVFKLLVKRR